MAARSATAASQPVLSIRDLRISLPLHGDRESAVTGVSIEVEPPRRCASLPDRSS
jgi:ABC-type glutathione transport system ATPase component